MSARFLNLSRAVLAGLLLLMLFTGVQAHAQSSKAAVVAQPNALPPPGGDEPNDPPYNAAVAVSQSVPTTMTSGSVNTVTVTMVNTGTTTWSSAGTYGLGAVNPHNNTTWGTARIALPASVAPGQGVTLTFSVTAPAVPGTYNLQWQMVQDSLEWFGAQSSNVAVAVSAPAPRNGAQAVELRVPPLTQGQVAVLSVTMQNTGSTTWAAGSNYKLGSKNPDETAIWGVQLLDLASDVAPGQQYTFTFPITAPAAGTYTMQWQMMQRYVEYFGALASAAVTVGVASGDTVTYIHTDALGSPVARSDSAGNVISRTSYEPYGRTASGVTPTIGFTGHVNDADTGLVYMQQRYYDPVAGRFLSIDPVTTDANTGDSFNRYAYVENNPYRYIDPDGRGLVDGLIKVLVKVVVAAVKTETKQVAKGAAKEAVKDGEKVAVEAAKRGPKTDPTAPHNAKIRELGDKVEAEGGEVLAGGGRKPEVLVPTPGGIKGGRRPDMISRDANGNVSATQVGRTKADGTPVKREVEALKDLNGPGQLPTNFEGYTH
ncbi:RHS repeat-associated core domain-containing protein [Massilia sp. DWR3-1-1]|uniref:RHS repeat-associated core domain-containing protein n=1 Tax=Massilia sp. DWR3-1-1 TaxID=2804559 RepID=UPI003CE88E53